MTPPTKTRAGRKTSRPNRYLDKGDKGDERGRGDGGGGWTKVQSKKKPPKAKAKPSKAKAKGKPKTPSAVKKGAGARPTTRARKGHGSPSNHTPDGAKKASTARRSGETVSAAAKLSGRCKPRITSPRPSSPVVTGRSFLDVASEQKAGGTPGTPQTLTAASILGGLPAAVSTPNAKPAAGIAPEGETAPQNTVPAPHSQQTTGLAALVLGSGGPLQQSTGEVLQQTMPTASIGGAVATASIPGMASSAAAGHNPEPAPALQQTTGLAALVGGSSGAPQLSTGAVLQQTMPTASIGGVVATASIPGMASSSGGGYQTRDLDVVAQLTLAEFALGKLYPTRDKVKDVADELGRNNLFICGLSGYNWIKCSLHPQPKLATDQGTRAGHSHACGCPWGIKLSRSKKTEVVSIAEVNPLHNHPLTTASFEVAQKRSGKPLAAAVRAVTDALAPSLSGSRKPTCDHVREMLKPRVGNQVELSSQNIGSIVRGVRAQIRAGKVTECPKLDKDGLEQFRKFSAGEVSTEKSREALNEILSTTSGDLSWVVSRLLQRLKEKDPDYFDYRLSYDDNDMVDGCVWQGGRARAALKMYGARGFWDMRVSEEMNAIRYVYASWVVIDPNNQFIPGSEALVLGELDAFYKFLHKGSVGMTPGLNPEDIIVAWADDKVKGDKVRKYFPNCLVMLDTYHLLVGERGVCILSKSFGAAWVLVKGHFHAAVYATTEDDCLVCNLYRRTTVIVYLSDL